MKAIAVTPGKKNSARLIDLDKPGINDNEVLIQTFCVGIDGTDVEINQAEYGTAPEGSDYLIIGHEAIGKILKVGSKAISEEFNFEVGDIVVPTVRRPDDCHYCQSNQPDMCIKGDYTEHGIKGKHGFLREFFPCDPKYLVKIPEDIQDYAVLLEPLSVVEKGIRQGWKIQERMAWNPKTALVLGLGPIGILGSFLLALKGLDVWIYSMEDPSNPKVKIIERLGIHYLSSEIDIEEVPNKIGKNIDFILEATGNSIVAIKAMSMVGQNGLLCLTGVTGGHKKITICADCLNLDLVLGNKLIYGTVNANIIDFEQGVKDMRSINENYSGIFNNIISHRYSPEDYKDAIEDFEGIKAVINFNK